MDFDKAHRLGAEEKPKLETLLPGRREGNSEKRGSVDLCQPTGRKERPMGRNVWKREKEQRGGERQQFL